MRVRGHDFALSTVSRHGIRGPCSWAFGAISFACRDITSGNGAAERSGWGLRRARCADRFTPCWSRNRDYATSWDRPRPHGQQWADDTGWPAFGRHSLLLAVLSQLTCWQWPSSIRRALPPFIVPYLPVSQHLDSTAARPNISGRPTSTVLVASRCSPHAPPAL